MKNKSKIAIPLMLVSLWSVSCDEAESGSFEDSTLAFDSKITSIDVAFVDANQEEAIYVDFSDHKSLEFFTQSNIEKGFIFNTSENTLNSNATFKGESRLSAGDQVYAIYTGYGQNLNPQLVKVDLSQQELVTQVYAGSSKYKNGSDVSMNLSPYLVKANISMILPSSYDCSQIESIHVTSPSIYISRNLDIRNTSGIKWVGGHKNSEGLVLPFSNVKVEKNDTAQVCVFSLYTFPTKINQLIIEVYNRDLSKLYQAAYEFVSVPEDGDREVGILYEDVFYQPSDDLELKLPFIPVSPSTDTSLEGMVNGGNLFDN